MNAIDSLFKTLTSLQEKKKLPPVEMWQPDHVGSIDIVINNDGEWLHEGTIIQRQPLVNLFATILKREGDTYYLVTPAEKLAIQVADVPFIVTDMDVRGAGKNSDLLFTTNVGDYVMAGPDHPVAMREERPYLTIRHGLEARLSRSVYYRLVDYGIEQADHLYVYSQGQAFDLGTVQ